MKDAASILSINLPQSQLDDKLTSRGEKSRIYTVRSGYRLLLPQSQVDPRRKKLFKTIWNLDYPSKNVWSKLNIFWNQEANLLPLPEWISWLFVKYNGYSRNTIAYIIWALWFARNKQLHEGKIQEVNEIVFFIFSYGYDYGRASHSITQPFTRAQIKWSPPPHEWVKVNVDACYSHESNTAFSDISGSSLVFMEEAKAAIHGLTFAADLGLHHVILENDSKTLVRKVVSKEDDFSEIRVVVADLKNIAKKFVGCQFCFTPRQGNRVAHAITAIG
ncbi:hypothetical protein GQ457_03G011070 [Hibiscus cannabinus]